MNQNLDKTEEEKLQLNAESANPAETAEALDPAEEAKKLKEERRKDWIETIAIFGGAILLVIILQTFVFINARIPSGSMENTVMTGERLYGNRLSYTFGEPERYDIAVFRYPDDESKLFIKRVIGLPGETVTIKEDGVYINDATEPLSEDFCPEIPDYTLWIGMSWTIPDNCYFMMGDNRNHSADSRYWNQPFVVKKNVLAKAGLRYWPLNKIGFIGDDTSNYYEPEADK